MPDPPSNPAPAPPDPKEARSIPDQLMVFHSYEDPTPKVSTKEMKMKNLKNRVRARKSTPAPLTKGHGRKRFVPSPLPEDKQLRKKLDFGTEDSSGPETTGTSPGPDSSSCKTILFPACPSGSKEAKGPKNQPTTPPTADEGQMALVVRVNSPASATAPTSEHGPAKSEKTVGEGDAKSPYISQEDLADTCDPKSTFGSEMVNLPDMGMGTNHLS